MKREIIFLVDRLDEGYEPDGAGIGIIDGFLHAAIEVKDRVSVCRSIVFLALRERQWVDSAFVCMKTY